MDLEVRELMERASRGHAPSQRELAERFYYGRGVGRSVAEAFGWLLLAAKGGDDGARHFVCELCRRGMLRVPIGPLLK